MPKIPSKGRAALEQLLETPNFASGGAVRKAFDHLILKGADLPNEGLEVLKNASSKEARDFAKVTREQNIRTALDPEGNSYVWDAYYGTHKPVAEALGHQLGELEPNEADWLTDVFALDKGKMLSLQNVQPHVDGTDRLELGLSQKERDDLHKARWKQFYPYSVLFGAPAFADEEQRYAAGGAVRAGAESALHGLTLGLDETIPSLVAGHYAKFMRPDLFEDFTANELVGIVEDNLEAARRKREEEHPYADTAGMLLSGIAPMGLAKTLLGQMGTGAAMTALQSLNDGDSAEDIGINSAFGAAIPPALRYWKVAAPAGAAGALYGLKQAYADE